MEGAIFFSSDSNVLQPHNIHLGVHF